jgi:hypothetical protein
MSTLYSIGAINQLADALENAGFSPDDVTKLKQFGNLRDIKDVLNGKAEIAYLERLIDCDAAPSVPDDWSVVEHRKGGLWRWNPARVSLYYAKKTITTPDERQIIRGHDFREELMNNQLVMNANLLDYLLAYPALIPEEWKGKIIFFFGTIYHLHVGGLCVRGLYWDKDQHCWYDYFRWLDWAFDSSCEAAVLKVV